MIIYGIIVGLLSALLQSVSYLFARKFSSEYQNSNIRLLISSQILMGIAGLIALPFCWPTHIDWNWNWIQSVILCVFFSLAGQLLIFFALHSAEASKISPLLALKVVMLAFLTWWMMGIPLNYLHWLGVLLCLAGTFILNFSGGGISRRAIIGVLGACLFYSLSDINITILVENLENQMSSRWGAVFFSICAIYILCGILCFFFMFFVKEARWSDIKSSAIGFSLAWLVAMVFMFATFSIVGAVYGNILQSMRGVISIFLGVLIAGMGHQHIESHMSKKVFWQRLIAALLMTTAIVAFGAGGLNA